MQRQLISVLLIVFVGATFWAYTIADSLIREFSGNVLLLRLPLQGHAGNVTYVDLGALFILGLISGFALGQIFVLYRRKGFDSG